jgi:hypothetical protein
LLGFVWFYLVLFVRIVTFQWVTADPNRNFPPALGNPFWLQNARALRPVMMFVGVVAEFSAIEFPIAGIIAEVSPLRKKMSHILDFHSPAATSELTGRRKLQWIVAKLDIPYFCIYRNTE